MFVDRLAVDTPAHVGGLRNGDVITHVNATPVSDDCVLRGIVRETQPGESLQLEVYRFGATVPIDLTVGREVFQPSRRLDIGFGRWRFQPIPTPYFNAFNLIGFERRPREVDLASPSLRYFRHVQELGGGEMESVSVDREWEVCLALISLSGGRRIYAQELACGTVTEVRASSDVPDIAHVARLDGPRSRASQSLSH